MLAGKLYNSGRLFQYVIVLSFISVIERSTALITVILICIYYQSQYISAVCVCVLHAGPGGSSLCVLSGCLVWS